MPISSQKSSLNRFCLRALRTQHPLRLALAKARLQTSVSESLENNVRDLSALLLQTLRLSSYRNDQVIMPQA